MKVSSQLSQPRPCHRSAELLRAGLIVALIYALLAPAAGAQQDAIAPSALRQMGTLLAEKASRTPAQRKISSRLLYEIKRQRNDPALAGLPELRSGVTPNEAGLVLVDITAEVSGSLLSRIERLGGRLVNHHERFDAVRAEMPLTRIEALAEWTDLRSIRPAERYMTQAVITEGDVAHRADVARTTSGADGSGVTACAISDSIDELATLIASGELPAGTTFLAGQSGNPGTSEGTALLEIIHDIAPGSDLIFATAAGGQAQFAQNILDLAAAGCDVIVDDAIYFAEGVFQDGIVAQAVETVAAQGVIYVSAAGNSGNENDGTSGVYEGEFLGTTLPAPIGAPPGSLAHDFTGSGATGNSNVIGEPGFGIGNDAAFFTLQWADPLGGSANDYDLFLLNPAKTGVLAFSINIQDGDDDPFEEIPSIGIDDTANRLVVVKKTGSAVKFFHLNTHRGELVTASTNGQIFGHPAAANAIAVAAVDVSTAGGAGGVFDGTESVETFSSDGPRRIYFNAAGGPPTFARIPGTDPGSRGVAEFIIRHKPDVAAADGVSTTSSNFTTFFGTSASAPHVAAISALIIEGLEPLMTDFGMSIQSVPQMRGLFAGTALDIEAPGFDEDSGSGILDAGGALDAQNIFADGFESGDTSAWTDN